MASRIQRMRGNLSALVRHDFDRIKGRIGWMVTLTYRPGEDWQANHVRDAFRKFSNWAKYHHGGARYVWVAELQGRGAVHYHLIAWLPQGVAMPHWDTVGWWSHGMTRSEQLLTGIGYVLKYLSKISHFHKFPKGLRLSGSGGFSDEARAVRQWKNLPDWCRQQYGVGEVRRTAYSTAPEPGSPRKSGLVVSETGEILESPWIVMRGAGRLFLRCVGELPSRFADGPWVRFQPIAPS